MKGVAREGGVSLFDAALLWLWLKINFSFCSLQRERPWVAPSNDQPVAEKRHDGVRSVLFTFHSARQHRNHDVEKPYGDNMKESKEERVCVCEYHSRAQLNPTQHTSVEIQDATTRTFDLDAPFRQCACCSTLTRKNASVSACCATSTCREASRS
jgi:hypothetical protein